MVAFLLPACQLRVLVALRRWGERAVGAGALTVDQIRNADPAACTLLLSGNSPAPVGPPANPACVAPTASLGDADELLDELLEALLELPRRRLVKVTDMLLAGLVDKLCGRIEASTG